MRLLGIVGIILILAMVLGVQMRLDELEEQKNELYEEVERQADKVEELQYEIKRPIDDAFLIELAREKLGYYQYDDTIFYYSRGECK